MESYIVVHQHECGYDLYRIYADSHFISNIDNVEEFQRELADALNIDFDGTKGETLVPYGENSIVEITEPVVFDSLVNDDKIEQLETELDVEETVEQTIERYMESVNLNYAMILMVVEELKLGAPEPEAFWVYRYTDELKNWKWGLTYNKYEAQQFPDRREAFDLLPKIKQDIERDGTDKVLGYHIYNFGPLEE